MSRVTPRSVGTAMSSRWARYLRMVCPSRGQVAEKGPAASLAPSAAGSTYREYASPAAFGRPPRIWTFLSRLQVVERSGWTGGGKGVYHWPSRSLSQGGASMSLRLGDTAPDFTAESTE